MNADVEQRRQVIRRIDGGDAIEPSMAIAVLRSALDDRDWEVRVAAILASTRLRAPSLRSAIDNAQLPSPNQFTLTEADVYLLIAARMVAVEAADVGDVADPAMAIVDRSRDVPLAFVRDVLGLETSWSSRSLLLHSLRTPLRQTVSRPDHVPAGIAWRDDGFTLGGSIAMVWIPPVPHIVGGLHDAPREFTPAGFFIAREPLPGDPITHADAVAECSALGEAVSLPTADELECAARGTDGRRFPWGNGIERFTGRERSPYGLGQFAVPQPQWTVMQETLGGPTSPYCAARVSETVLAAVRPVVRM